MCLVSGMGQGRGQMTVLRNTINHSDDHIWKLLRLMPLRPYSTSTKTTSTGQRQLYLWLRQVNPGISNWDTLSDVDGVVITYSTILSDGT